jgi:hypothetical protein
MEQVENRILGNKDKLEKLDQAIKDKEKILRQYK